MHECVIADTSCLIILERIGHLHLLQQLFDHIVITPQVAAEYGQSLPEWVSIQLYENNELFHQLLQKVDLGEASAIVLATERPDSTTVLDDYKARAVAKVLGLKITGTLGILIKAKERGWITEVKPILLALIDVGFRVDKQIYTEILKITGEHP